MSATARDECAGTPVRIPVIACSPRTDTYSMPARPPNPSRVEDPQRVERAARPRLQGQGTRVGFPVHAAALEQPDAMLPGDGAAERDRRVEELVERGLGGGPGRLVAVSGNLIRGHNHVSAGTPVPGHDRASPTATPMTSLPGCIA